MALELNNQLSHYISTVHAFPVLSREEEITLVGNFRERGDKKARDKLVEAHLRHVVAIALKYRRYAVPLGELVAEGNFGIVHALEKFDLSKGTRFVTYAAYWIRAYILNHIIRSWSLVGVGSGALRSKMFFKLRRERVRIYNLVGEGEKADELLAQRLNIPTQKLTTMMQRLESRDLSLDAKLYDDSGATLGDALVVSEANQEDAASLSEVQGDVQEAVRTAVADLDQRERYIVENRLMAEREDELSLAEIGRHLGVSRERARQLEARALRKLKTRITELSQDRGWLEYYDAA